MEATFYQLKDSVESHMGLLQKPLKFGWKRNVDGRDNSVVYSSPCGRQFRVGNKDTLNVELLRCKVKELRMENFSFDAQIPVSEINEDFQNHIGRRNIL